MKIHILFVCALLISTHLADETDDKIAKEMLNQDTQLINNPERVSTKDDLRTSYNQMMALENSPDEKAKMDKLMEELAGIKAGSDDSLATSKNITEIEETPIIKDKKDKDARKLEISEPGSEMNALSANLGPEEDPIPTFAPGLDGPSDLDDTLPEKASDDVTKGANSEKGRKLNVDFSNNMSDGMNSPNMDMVNMQNSFDDTHSMGPGSGSMGTDNLNDLDTGMHQQATSAMINRMDQTTQENFNRLNSMFPPPSKLMPRKKKKKSNVIDIRKMLKKYPPQLVDQFMPELKDRVMKKFENLRKTEKQNKRIRKLKLELEKEKKREKRRRQLRQRRRRRALERRRHHHHHHHHHHFRPKHHFKPHFSLKNLHKKQFHSISVVNRFMHRRPNQLHRLHHLKERMLADKTDAEHDSSEFTTNSEDSFMKIEDELNKKDKSSGTSGKGKKISNGRNK